MARTTIPPELVAVNAIQGTLIADNSVTAVHIATNAISGTLVADNAVTSTHIAQNQVTATQIAQNTITVTQMADDAIETAKINASAVTTAKINNGAVTDDKLAANSVTSAKIVNGTIVAADLADNAVTIAKMASLARGKLIYGDSAGDPAALALGSAGTFLISDGTDISWSNSLGTGNRNLGIGAAEFNSSNYSTLNLRGTTGGQVLIGRNSGANDWDFFAFTTNGLTRMGTASGDDLAIHTNSSGSSNERIRIDSSGNIGIGTSSPAQKLHVAGGQARFDDHISIQPTKKLYLDGGNDTYIDEETANAISINTGGGERMRLNTTGVGIGTTGPVTKLHVRGTASNTMTAANSFAVFDGTGGDGIIIGARSSSPFEAYIQSGYTPNIGTSHHYPLLLNPHGGNVGINSTSPQTKFVVQHTNGQNGIEFSMGASLSYIQSYNRNTSAYSDLKFDGATLRFGTNDGTERMRIDANGNVGIGRTPESDIYSLSSISLGNGSMIYASKSGNEPNIDFLDNAFLNSAGNFEYQRSGKSTKVEQYNGTWTFANAPAGTAGNTATFTERMRITSNGNLQLALGSPLQATADGRAVNVSVGTSFVTILDFSTIGGTNAGRGFYLVTVVREGASVGTSITLQVGVSSSGLVVIYDTLQANSLSAQASNAQIQVKHLASGSVECHATAIPMSITGTG